MSEKLLQNYSWIDIIEPEITTASYSAWQYLLITALVTTLLIIIIKHFNLLKKVTFWLIRQRLKRTHYSRTEIKKILHLFGIEKGIQYLPPYMKPANNTEIATQRHILLNAYYAKIPVNPEQINKALKIMRTWL